MNANERISVAAEVTLKKSGVRISKLQTIIGTIESVSMTKKMAKKMAKK